MIASRNALALPHSLFASLSALNALFVFIVSWLSIFATTVSTPCGRGVLFWCCVSRLTRVSGYVLSGCTFWFWLRALWLRVLVLLLVTRSLVTCSGSGVYAGVLTCHGALSRRRGPRVVVVRARQCCELVIFPEVCSCLMSNARGAGRGGMPSAAVRCGRWV